MIDYTCPNCGSEIAVAEELVGSTGHCGACGKSMTVAPSGVAPPPLPKSPLAESPSWAKRMWEAILDPHTIQWVLMLGGGLLVLGLVIWLGSQPFFRQARVLAVAMTVATAALAGTGWFIVLRTRYKIAGQAITLLACIAAPLSLWFFDAQGIVTVEGQLWVAGLLCCLAYGVTAYVLRHRLFVFVAEGGVVLTGLLLMANRGLAGQVSALSLFLVVIGVISIHIERAFPPNDSPFSRKKFGLAAFWSGHLQMGVGLLLLLHAQMVGWLRLPFESFLGYEWGDIAKGGAAVQTGLLWLVATYVYLYSDLVVRRIGVYIYLAAVSLLVAIITLVGWRFEVEGIILALAFVVLGTNLAQYYVVGDSDRLSRFVAPLGVILGVLPLILGVALHMRATSRVIPEEWFRETGWLYVVAMAATALACRVAAFVQRKRAPRISTDYFFLTGGAIILAAAGLLRVLGLTNWNQQAPVLMLIPIVYMIASWLWRGQSPEHPVARVAHAATGVIMIGVLVATVRWAGDVGVGPIRVTGEGANLSFALAFVEAAVFYTLAAIVRRRGANVYLATAAASVALWQLLNYWEIQAAYSTLTFALLGLALLVTNRLLTAPSSELPAGAAGPGSDGAVPPAKARFQALPLVSPLFQCANALLTMAFIAASLQGLARLLGTPENLAGTIVPLVITTAVGAVAAFVVGNSGWRRWYFTVCAILTFVIFQTLNAMLLLSSLQKLEILAVAVGLIGLGSSYVGMFREESERSETVGFGLWIGSMLSVLPLLAAVIFHRFYGGGVSLFDELALLTISVLMLVTGLAFKVKSATFLGAGTLVAHLVLLIVSVGFIGQLAVGAYLAIGGAVLFVLGIALSIYRERLVRLPESIANREGIFKMIAWR